MARIDYLAILEEAWQQHLAPKANDAPTVISTFAGCGGSSLGYSMAGYRELLAVEWNDNAIATFKLNFPDVPVYHGDIHKLSVEECLELTGIKKRELDLLDGSPPCQGFSTAGKRKIDDKRNQLYMQFVRLLRGLQPKVFVMENVSGLVKGKMKLIFADIMRELKASGYKVRCKLLNAMYFNVPQSRQRLIFIGMREDFKSRISFPIPKTVTGCVRLDERNCKLSYRRYGDSIQIEGRPSKTITAIGRRFWTSELEWGQKSYKVNASFPLAFRFANAYKKSIGNSVPPLFMRAIAQHIRDHQWKT